MTSESFLKQGNYESTYQALLLPMASSGSPQGTGFIRITSEGESLDQYKRCASNTSDENSAHLIPKYGMDEKLEDPQKSLPKTTGSRVPNDYKIWVYASKDWCARGGWVLIPARNWVFNRLRGAWYSLGEIRRVKKLSSKM